MQQFIAMSSFDPSEMASIMARPGLLKSSVEIRYFYSVNGFIHDSMNERRRTQYELGPNANFISFIHRKTIVHNEAR